MGGVNLNYRRNICITKLFVVSLDVYIFRVSIRFILSISQKWFGWFLLSFKSFISFMQFLISYLLVSHIVLVIWFEYKQYLSFLISSVNIQYVADSREKEIKREWSADRYDKFLFWNLVSLQITMGYCLTFPICLSENTPAAAVPRKLN